MSQEKKRYKAKIANNTYTIIGTESKTHMDIVTEIANEQLQDILSLSPNTDLSQGSILLAINTLSDQLKKEERILYLEEEIIELKEKTKRVEELETRLKRYDEMESQAKKAIFDAGQQSENMSPVEVQRVMNQQVIEKIQQNAEKINQIQTTQESNKSK
ncbi:cell division protein ZapA [Vagococcus salmoninarum]|uniref:cell division protein ZapA n=1 Tax=Vagococcus salmoninarum TaxID=2739 RepID=UPI00187E8793|nr:cell division protein ZapA [Vagococcus salmoninarum]MBE9388377.1 cell division protein ZapA [Vagococcus salmoninarum]